MDLENFKQSVITLVIVALLIGAAVLAVDGFQDAIEDDNPCVESGAVWNATDGDCTYSGNDTVLGGPNDAYNVTQEGLEGVSNASSYLSTIGTLLGVAALIAVVVGAFMFVRK